MVESVYHRTLRINIIKFVIWCILMTINLVYASAKPVELTTLRSSIDVVTYKVWLLWHRTQWSENIYMQKYDLLNQSQEILSSIHTSCFDPVDEKILRDAVDEIHTIPLDEFSARIMYFSNIAYDTKEKLDRQCTMK